MQIFKLLKTLGTGIGAVLSPKQQIQAVGSRRVWVSLVLLFGGGGMIILMSCLGLSNTIILAFLGVIGGTGGSFVVGESVRDVKAAQK